jgi:hypothetical protein
MLMMTSPEVARDSQQKIGTVVAPPLAQSAITAVVQPSNSSNHIFSRWRLAEADVRDVLALPWPRLLLRRVDAPAQKERHVIG